MKEHQTVRIEDIAHGADIPVSAIKKIGLLLQSRQGKNILHNPFYSLIIESIQENCRLHQIEPVYMDVAIDEHGHTIHSPELSIDQQLEGLLVLGMHLDEDIIAIMERLNVPTVLVDSYSNLNNYDAVIIANYQGTYDAISYLVKQGHRHIAIAGSAPVSFTAIEDRRLGYKQALYDHGIHNMYYIDSIFEQFPAYQATYEFLKQKTPVTAIFSTCDWVALGVMRAVRESGFEINQQISVMGFDDSLVASHTDPPLTTMRVDTTGMGQLSISMLINRIQNPGKPMIKVALRPQLIERQSVCKINYF